MSMDFRHERVDGNPPAGRMTNLHATDITGNGKPDIVVTALGVNPRVTVPGIGELQLRYTSGVMRLIPYLETNVLWYENASWERHAVSTTRDLQIGVGSATCEFGEDGRPGLVAGQGTGESDVYWFESGPDPREPWDRYTITDAFQKYHDLAVADVDDDGEPELVGLSQESDTLFYCDVPADPRRSPWPAECLHVVDDDIHAEGLAVVDIDGDGRTEIVAGPALYHRTDAGSWERETIATGWEYTRVAVGDLDGDGEHEVVLSEGDSPALGTRPGRVAVLDPPDWEPVFLREEMYCPHSLQVADFDGDGRLDVFVAEMGLFDNDDPAGLVFRNLDDGEFEEHVVSRGIPTHEAKAVDLTGDGSPDIVGKSYEPTAHVDVWYNET